MSSARPNVLLIVFDTARADAFEPYGAPSGSSPVLAELARRGTAFPLAMSTSNWTWPSHASMFTGLLPRTFGLRSEALRDRNYREASKQLLEIHRARFLPDVLRRHGYDTRAVSANPWIGPATGMPGWFDEFVDVGTLRPNPSGLRGHARWWSAATDSGAGAALETFRSWFAEPRERPAFWFANIMECHSPYYPPKPYNDLGPFGRWRAVDDVIDFQDPTGFLRVAVGELDVPRKRLLRMRHLYRRSIRLMDDWLGRVMEELAAGGLLDDTLVVVVADHGENFGEGHLTGHIASLDQRLLHVPLVIAGPGTPPPRDLVSLAELPRMIGEAVGLEDSPWIEEHSERAIVIAHDDGFMKTVDRAALERARALGTSDAALRRLTAHMETATDGRFKLVHYLSGEHLYDLANDPLETTDVADRHPGQVAVLRASLEAANAQRVAGASPGPAPSGPAPDLSAEQEAEIEQHLEQLGYL